MTPKPPNRLETASLMLGFDNSEVAAFMKLAKVRFPDENRDMLETRVIHLMREQRDSLSIQRARNGVSDEPDDGA